MRYGVGIAMSIGGAAPMLLAGRELAMSFSIPAVVEGT